MTRCFAQPVQKQVPRDRKQIALDRGHRNWFWGCPYTRKSLGGNVFCIGAPAGQVQRITVYIRRILLIQRAKIAHVEIAREARIAAAGDADSRFVAKARLDPEDATGNISPSVCHHAGPQALAPQGQYSKQKAEQHNFCAGFDALIPVADPK